jgi:hypothetical protein
MEHRASGDDVALIQFSLGLDQRAQGRHPLTHRNLATTSMRFAKGVRVRDDDASPVVDAADARHGARSLSPDPPLFANVDHWLMPDLAFVRPPRACGSPRRTDTG